MKYLLLLKWPIALTILGMGLWVLAGVTVIGAIKDTGTSFTGPGETTVSVSEPGNYRLWLETRTYLDGHMRTFPDQLPSGTSIRVFRTDNEDPVSLEATRGNMTMELRGVKRVSLGRMDMPEAGDYTFAIDGLDDERAFYLSEIRFLPIMIKTILSSLAGLGLIIAGIIWGMALVIRYKRWPDRDAGNQA